MTEAMCNLSRLCHPQRCYTRLALCENHRLDLLEAEWLDKLIFCILADDH